MSSEVGSIPSTAGVIPGSGEDSFLPWGICISKGKLKGNFNPVYLTQFVLSFNSYESFFCANYESFFCASPVLGIKNTAVHSKPQILVLTGFTCVWGGWGQQRKGVSRMLDGRQVWQEKGPGRESRRCRGHGAGAGVEREKSPCCFRAGLKSGVGSLKQEDTF